MIKEILAIVSILQNKVYLNKDVLNKFPFNHKDRLMWYINENDELVLSRANKIESKKMITTDIEDLYKIKKPL